VKVTPSDVAARLVRTQFASRGIRRANGHATPQPTIIPTKAKIAGETSILTQLNSRDETPTPAAMPAEGADAHIEATPSTRPHQRAEDGGRNNCNGHERHS
jgi:hypothetical protein